MKYKSLLENIILLLKLSLKNQFNLYSFNIINFIFKLFDSRSILPSSLIFAYNHTETNNMKKKTHRKWVNNKSSPKSRAELDLWIYWITMIQRDDRNQKLEKWTKENPIKGCLE